MMTYWSSTRETHAESERDWLEVEDYCDSLICSNISAQTIPEKLIGFFCAHILCWTHKTMIDMSDARLVICSSYELLPEALLVALLFFVFIIEGTVYSNSLHSKKISLNAIGTCTFTLAVFAVLKVHSK